MSSAEEAFGEFCNLLGLNDNTSVTIAKQRYHRFCQRIHPDKQQVPYPPPAVPVSAAVYNGNAFWFTAPSVPGEYKCNNKSYFVTANCVSTNVTEWSTINVLSRLNSIKSLAFSSDAVQRPRAYAPVNNLETVEGATVNVRFAYKRERRWSSEKIQLPLGRNPPYVLKGQKVDVYVFLRPS